MFKNSICLLCFYLAACCKLTTTNKGLMALFRDWRSPGEKWIRTDFGWRKLAEIKNSLNQQLRRQFSTSSGSSSKASSTNSSKKVSRATSPSQDRSPIPKGQVIWSDKGAAKPSWCAYGINFVHLCLSSMVTVLYKLV